jgi:hypothetical protein
MLAKTPSKMARMTVDVFGRRPQKRVKKMN